MVWAYALFLFRKSAGKVLCLMSMFLYCMCVRDCIYVPVSGGSVAHVHAIVRGTALLPCDLTPPAPNDSVVLVVWYKDEHTPIYR